MVAVTQGFDAEVARARWCRCGSRIFWSSRCRRSNWCAPARASPRSSRRDEPTEAQIYTFLPAVGGAGVTTLAVQTAMLLLNSGAARQGRRPAWSISISSTAPCADYLDLEPRLDLGEIEPRPERLDRQLLEVMLSHHASGLAVIAAPNRPAEMRSFDPDVVTRLLDLVSSHFDYVVFDMPRTWFSWTDSVLLGSNRLFIVSETTVPGLRHAKQLVDGDHGAARRRAEAAGHHQSLRAENVLVRACAAAISSRRSARLSPPRFPTITRWCARRSTAACRSTRSSPATRSRAAQEARAAASAGKAGEARRRC